MESPSLNVSLPSKTTKQNKPLWESAEKTKQWNWTPLIQSIKLTKIRVKKTFASGQDGVAHSSLVHCLSTKKISGYSAHRRPWKVARRGKGQGPRDLEWCSSGFSWVFFLPHVYIPSGVLEKPMPPKLLKSMDKSPKKTLFSPAKGLGKGLPGQKTFGNNLPYSSQAPKEKLPT